MTVVVKTIADIPKAIRSSVFLSLIVAIILSLAALNYVYFLDHKRQVQLNQQKLASDISLFKSHLSEKLSIIASSNEFMDYLRSGEVSREENWPQFLFSMRSLKATPVVGFRIEEGRGDVVFQRGRVTDSFVILGVCYLDKSLNGDYGVCRNSWYLYLDPAKVKSELIKLNSKIKSCDSCQPVNVLEGDLLGSFPVMSSGNLPLKIEIPTKTGYVFILSNIFLVLTLVVLTLWNWRRTDFLFDRYISWPIANITRHLKKGSIVEGTPYDVEEITYLIAQIEKWKIRFVEAQGKEKEAEIGRLVNLILHDIRSPLCVLETLFATNKACFDVRSYQLVSQALDSLKNISLSVLDDFKGRGSPTLMAISVVDLESSIKQLVEEKKYQHGLESVSIRFESKLCEVEEYVKINKLAARRVLSNLIDNAVEAFDGQGDKFVVIKLNNENNFINILILDNAKGIAPDDVNKVLKGGFTTKDYGYGMGVSSAVKFARDIGGDLLIESELGVGTKVTLSLPISDNLVVEKDGAKPDLILLDNDKLITETWVVKAKLRGKNILTFSDVCKFLNYLEGGDKNIPIYLDSDLGVDVRGEDLALELSKKGHVNIYLTTGFCRSQFESMSFLSGVIGKSPPF